MPRSSRVYFFDYSDRKKVLDGIEALLRESGTLRVVSEGDSVAVKVHMGELGNTNYLRPALVAKIVDLIKRAGGEPFVAETTTLYPRGRFTARDYLKTAAFNGFTKETVGAPIVIADGDGYDGIRVPIGKTVDGCEMREVEVASDIAKADAMIVASHAKGHMFAGFGGTVKNVAMGCATKNGKAAQHAETLPLFDESKCDGCGTCAEKCPFDALVMEMGRPVRNPEKCMNCVQCYFNCPSDAWYWPEGTRERFQVSVAHAARAVLSIFKRGKVGFVNFVQDVTSMCDCNTSPGRPVVNDVGILASFDPVAIDKASIDLIDRGPIISAQVSVKPPNLLGKLNGTDSLVQLRTAEKLGLGSLGYQLLDVS